VTDKSLGLIGKYRVERVDGKPVKWSFTLEDKDPLALPALKAYSQQARAAGYTALANDLDEKIREIEWDRMMESWPPEARDYISHLRSQNRALEEKLTEKSGALSTLVSAINLVRAEGNDLLRHLADQSSRSSTVDNRSASYLGSLRARLHERFAMLDRVMKALANGS